MSNHRTSGTEQGPEEHSDAVTAASPAMQAIPDDVRALRGLLEAIGRLPGDHVSDELLAGYLTARYLQALPPPPTLQPLFDAVQQRIDADPALRQRARTLCARLRALEARHDAVTRFERLTGHRLALRLPGNGSKLPSLNGSDIADCLAPTPAPI